MRAIVIGIVSLLSSTASAQDFIVLDDGGEPPPTWSTAWADRPLTVPKGRWMVGGWIRFDLSKDQALGSMGLAPEAAYGITDELTISLGHDWQPTSGAIQGLCLGDSCPVTYSGFDVAARYSLGWGNGFEVAALAAFDLRVMRTFEWDPDAGMYGDYVGATGIHPYLRFGAESRLRRGRFTLDGSALVAVGSETHGQLALAFYLQASGRVALGLPITFTIQEQPSLSLGVAIHVGITPNVDLSLQLTMVDLLLEGYTERGGLDGSDWRTLGVFVGYRR